MNFNQAKIKMLYGVLLIALLSCAAFLIAELPFVKKLSFSPLIVGILLGMVYANTWRKRLPESWVPGIQFSAKQLLRLGIILYGFRLTIANIMEVGWSALAVDAIIVVGTILIGILFGRMLKMDRDTALLTSVGSSICGAAAVLGADATIKPQPYKTAVAVSTVVIFGTISMFLYPVLYRNGWLGLEPQQMGLYTGATLHEVAHVVGAGNAMGAEIQDTATIVKMIRVIMLVPVLLVLAFTVRPKEDAAVAQPQARKGKIAVPWFAFIFLLVIGFNSLNIVPSACIGYINAFDTFLLTMAMTALGTETSFDKFKKAGPRPFLLAFLLYIWLFFGGYALTRYLAPLI